MIKGIAGHGYLDELIIPIIENTPRENELADSLGDAIRQYPKTCAVLVRDHGIYVWGETWEAAKRHSECLHYLFNASIQLHQLGLGHGQGLPQQSQLSSSSSSCCKSPSTTHSLSSTTSVTTVNDEANGNARKRKAPSSSSPDSNVASKLPSHLQEGFECSDVDISDVKYVVLDIEGEVTWRLSECLVLVVGLVLHACTVFV